MISEQLQKKIDRSVKLLQGIAKGYDGEIEVAYSGGKDSDVILQLAKESGIRYRAIYKNTTIDPPGTIRHAKQMGVEILMPRNDLSFFKIIEKSGYPTRMRRICCDKLKEYKVLDKCIIGVRREESVKRAKRYTEPTECRFFGSKKEHVEQIYPILDWTSSDIEEFAKDRKMEFAPLYYDEQGKFHVERRLGCMCCPLAYEGHRIEEFKKYPNMVKAYIKAGKRYLELHPQSKTARTYADEYEYFYRNVFCKSQQEWNLKVNGMFGKPDFKAFLERFFSITL